MDTSEQYIKMRLAAIPDLMEGTRPQIGVDIENETIDPEWMTHEVFVDIKGDFYYASGINRCQLERQDQLQTMILDNYDTFQYLLHEFYNFSLYFKGTSMEQLWLAFVMSQLHSKVWDGDSWVASG